MRTEVGVAARTAAREAREVAIPAAVARPRPAVVGALARIEARKLLTSPAFFAGIGFVFAFSFLITGGQIFASDDAGSTGHQSVVIVLAFGIGLIAATLFGANACSLRAHRDGVRELFGALPAPAQTRTAAILSALTGPVIAAIALAVVAHQVLRTDPGLRPNIDIALLAQYPLTVLALGAFGVALARWVRHPIAAPVALVGMVMTPLVWWVPWIAHMASGIRMGWHYTYLIAVIVFWMAFAFAGDRRQARAFVIPVVAFSLAVVAAILQIPSGGLL